MSAVSARIVAADSTTRPSSRDLARPPLRPIVACQAINGCVEPETVDAAATRRVRSSKPDPRIETPPGLRAPGASSLLRRSRRTAASQVEVAAVLAGKLGEEGDEGDDEGGDEEFHGVILAGLFDKSNLMWSNKTS
jgi:hypothetical protein